MKLLIFLFALMTAFLVFNVSPVISESVFSWELSGFILLLIFIGFATGYFFVAFAVWFEKMVKPLGVKINKAFHSSKKLNTNNGVIFGVIIGAVLTDFGIRPWLDSKPVLSMYLSVAAAPFLMGAILYSMRKSLYKTKDNRTLWNPRR